MIDSLVIITAILISIILGLVGYRYRVVNTKGFISGVILSMGILLCFIYGYQDTWIGVKWFLLLVGFVLIAGIATRYKYSVKQELHVAEKKCGRGIENVVGNGLAAFLFAVLFLVAASYKSHQYENIFLIGYTCAIATATADTVAAEIGQLSKRKPLMITTMKDVEVGTDGGVTSLGEISAFFGAALIAAIPLTLGIGGNINGVNILIIASIAGFIGCNIDSLVGATLERRGVFNKHLTNLFATLGGGLVGVVIAVLIL